MKIRVREFSTACVAFVLALAGVARAVEPPDPLLWKIEGPKKTSYLFGTIHLTRPSVTTLGAQVTDALSSADAVYTEVPMDMGTMLSATTGMLLPGNQTLNSVLPPELLEKLSTELAAINPIFTIDTLQKFQPWALAATLMILEDQMKYPGAMALDMTLFQKAAMAGKETGGIETIGEQLSVFDHFSKEEQIQMLSETVDFMRKSRADGVSPIDPLVNAYLAGDLAKVDAEMEKWNAASEDPKLTERFMQHLLYDRNVRMAERMAEKIHTHPDTSYLFAVGAAHLGGDKGVIALLEQEGFRVTRVE